MENSLLFWGIAPSSVHLVSQHRNVLLKTPLFMSWTAFKLFWTGLILQFEWSPTHNVMLQHLDPAGNVLNKEARRDFKGSVQPPKKKENTFMLPRFICFGFWVVSVWDFHPPKMVEVDEISLWCSNQTKVAHKLFISNLSSQKHSVPLIMVYRTHCEHTFYQINSPHENW